MNQKRVVVIGLDGATLDLVAPWASQGKLSTFQQLMQEGAWGTLRSTMPPITAPAWTSFMTGKNPGKHGLYDFTGRRPGSYQTRPFNASHRNAESLWSILSRAGKQVSVVNVPMTYPPEPVNGCLISGMGTPATAKDFCYPADLLPVWPAWCSPRCSSCYIGWRWCWPGGRSSHSMGKGHAVAAFHRE